MPKTTVAAIKGPDQVFDCLERASWKREREIKVASRIGFEICE